MDDLKGLVGVKEAAKLLDMGVTRVYEKANKGEIPCFKLGGKWKFDPKALKKWWEEESIIHERSLIKK